MINFNLKIYWEHFASLVAFVDIATQYGNKFEKIADKRNGEYFFLFCWKYF